MSKEEKKQTTEEKEYISSNKNTDSKKDVMENLDDELDNEDSNLDSIDFNMNPFNNNDTTNGEKHKESDDFSLSKKEDKNIQMNNLNDDNFNLKLNLYSDTWKNPMSNSNPENISLNFNNDYKNIFNNMNNNYFPNNNQNYINFLNEQGKIANKNVNNKPIGFNTNNAINNNFFNIGFDIKAAPFLPKNSNIQINPNINNLNVNSSNNNDYLFTKGLQNWICPFCHTYNSKGKLLFILYNKININN